MTIWCRASASAEMRGRRGNERGGRGEKLMRLRHALGYTHVGTHGCDEDDGASALGDHVARRLARGEEGAVDVDVVEALYPVERVVERGVVLDDACAARRVSCRPELA